jgi:hypothetical protein
VKLVGRFSSSSTAVVAEATAAEEPDEPDEELLVVDPLLLELDEPQAASAKGTSATASTNASPRDLAPAFLLAGRAARLSGCPSTGTSFVSGI